MNRQEAIAEVTLLGDTDAKPALNATQVGTVVDQHALHDTAGVAPAADGWVPTYDVHGAVAKVWRIKAGRVAGAFDFTADDASFSKGDLLAHMSSMEARYAALAAADATERRNRAKSDVGTWDVSPYPLTTLDDVARKVIP